MQSKPQVHRKPARIARGVKMERELWEFAEWQASEIGERSASSMVRRWVMEKRDAVRRVA